MITLGKKIDWTRVLLGAGIAAATVTDIIPGDEILGVPIGSYLILEGLGILK